MRNEKKLKFGLLGKKLSHSFSKEIHHYIGNYEYKLYEKEEYEIKDFINSDITGFNITNPYKIEIIKYLDEISPEAKKIGAVNTVIKKCGKLIGYNTDYFGFLYLLNSFNINFKKAIILGDGATSKTISQVLKDKNVEFVVISRKNHPFYSEIYNYKNYDLLINATPVGMYPKNGESLVELEEFKNLKCVIDVIYNPFISDLLFKAKEKNIKYENGIKMLIIQAIESSKIFTDKKSILSEKEIEKIMKEKRNIVLIGMPGSGKSTIAKIIAKKTNKKLIDIDYEIEKKEKESIEDIFQKKGELYFRKLELNFAKKFGKENNQVIATGGGIVKDKRNYKYLKQNGKIYFINRKLKYLSTKNRPLSKNLEEIEKIYNERKNNYEYFSDLNVCNIKINDTANYIIGDFYENTCN